jgi:hypothetical protein
MYKLLGASMVDDLRLLMYQATSAAISVILLLFFQSAAPTTSYPIRWCLAVELLKVSSVNFYGV